ncbi:PREDICTED: uncharacterized protein LOC108971602 [Bactrocera latifrons]|uniref:Uncharacterized protein n=1 Tax=Bactrocera latifrons TaxID=174628 RepID=A0A0K8V342_BACLA|nr:PREDICTED: uncharacterized protein LOC108971602 [Bactrocera latifrons]
MSRTNFARTIALALLLTTASLLSWQAGAAKITTKALDASANNINSSRVELSHATEEPAVVVAPAAVIVESKANDEDELKYEAEVEADNAAAADTEADVEAADDDDDDDEEEDEDEDGEAESAAGAHKPAKSETALTAAEKNEDATASFSVWGMVRNVWNWIRDDLSESLFGDDDADATTGAQKALVREVRDVSDAAMAAVESRTFGKIRRLQMALIPLIFKFGILTAMVAFLIMLGMKTLFLVKLLVLMNAAAILAKFITLKSNFGGYEHSASQWNYQTWTPHATGGWGASAPSAPYSHGSEQHPSKEIHLHIHNGQVQGYGAGGHGGSNGWESRSDPYGAYAPTPSNEGENELNNQGPIAMLPTNYPSNPVYGNQ